MRTSGRNYALLHARSGQEAIALLERLKSKIELAIIDLDLPDSSGWDLIGRLTLHERKPLKIIAITSGEAGPGPNSRDTARNEKRWEHSR